MRSQPISSPEDQSVTFVELFFDLVFVFSVTQVVGLLHGGLDWTVVGQAILVFWLVWWAWSQFTWALNAADTTHPFVQLGTLLATAVAFFMAVALPDAFGERALWFAVAYVLVRVIGLVLYAWVASEDSAQQAAVRPGRPSPRWAGGRPDWWISWWRTPVLVLAGSNLSGHSCRCYWWAG